MNNNNKNPLKRKNTDNDGYLFHSKRKSNEENFYGFSEDSGKTMVLGGLSEECLLENVLKPEHDNIIDDEGNHLEELEAPQKIKEFHESDTEIFFFNKSVFGSTPKENNYSLEQIKYFSKLKSTFTNNNTGQVLKYFDENDFLPSNHILSSMEFKRFSMQKLNVSSNEFDSSANSSENNDSWFLDNSSLDNNANFVDKETCNDSFENMRKNFSKVDMINQCLNTTFSTPKTPSDMNEIVLDHVHNKQVQSTKSNPSTNNGRKCYDEIITESPVCYEQLKNPRKSAGRIQPTNMKHDSFKKVKTCEKIQEIPVEDVAKIIENDFSDGNYIYHIIDCRFPYEYEGGKIETAVNLFTPWKLLNYIFLGKDDREMSFKPLENPEESLENLLKTIKQIKKPNSDWKDKAFIFHCEFSSVRGPDMARLLRDVDILANLSCYPKIFFPKLFIMKKGYSEFYKKFQKYCKPQNYVRMDLGDSANSPLFNNEESAPLHPNFINEESRDQMLDQYVSYKLELQNQVLITDKCIRKLNYSEPKDSKDC